MLFWQILIDGFAISALYALGATGFTLIFGVSGVLNLSHGAIMVGAAVAAWAAAGLLHVDAYLAALVGIAVGMALAFATYFVAVRPIQQSKRIAESEREIFILTATLLWGIIIQELMIRVRKSVMEETGNQQIPWEEAALNESFSFLPDSGTPRAQGTRPSTGGGAAAPKQPVARKGNGTPNVGVGTGF